MSCFLHRLGAFVLAAAIFAPAAHADSGILSEVRLGVLAHDVPLLSSQKEHGADLNGELLLTSPIPASFGQSLGPSLQWLLHPRPDLGVELNTSGYTSQEYFGATWTAPLLGHVFGTSDGVFLGFSFGPSFNNGHVETTDPNRKSVGSNILFRESLDLGYYVAPKVSLSLFFDHESDAGITHKNEGLDAAGIRIGLGF
jgi:lipid A 3-O-deacylase